MPEAILEWGMAIILMVQSWGGWLTGPMNSLTFTGYLEFYILVLPALYWCYDTRLGIRVSIAIVLGSALNVFLKMVLHEPRPYWYDSAVSLLAAPEATFGLPSLHAQNAVVFWGLLAAHLKKGWAWIVALLLIFLVGFSRIYLGVHFPTDVIAGWLLGLIILLLLRYFEAPLLTRFTRRNSGQQISIAFLISLVIIGVSVGGVGGIQAGWQLPAKWVQTAALAAPDTPIAPFSFDVIVTPLGFFSGFVAGVILLNIRGGFDAGGVWHRRVARYLIGIVVALMIWRGLDVAFAQVAPDESLLGYTLRYIRYALAAFWMAYLGPLVFIRLGLATRGRQ